jgi:hypothetical protein
VKTYTLDQIVAVMRKKQYKIFLNDAKPHNLNIVGIRSNNPVPNSFDDRMFVFWKYKGATVLKQYRITTDPGTYWLKNPMNVNGTAILKPGQWEGLWKIGLHQGKYEALVQASPCTVLRDGNKDGKLDFNTHLVETGIFGINCHHAGEDSIQVDKWSAGCQVFAKLSEFEDFMDTCRRARGVWGNSFTYTLLEELDFEEVS